MNSARLLASLFVLFGASLGAIWFLGQGEATPMEVAGGTAREEIDDAGRPLLEGALAGNAADPLARSEVGADGLFNQPPLAKTTLRVTGRVVDRLGNAVGGAKVQVLHRESFGGFGRNGQRGGNGAAGTTTTDAGTDPAAAGRGRGWRGNPDQEPTAADRQRFEAMRARFTPKPIAEAVTTGGDGRYALSGDAYVSADLTVAVTHVQFAPTVERRTWQAAVGDLALADIVLHEGVMVAGVVVDDAEQPVAGAEVTYERVQTDQQDQGPGFNNGGRGNNGRGGRGNGGPGGGGNGRGGFFADPLQDLIAKAVSESTGTFRIGPVPSGTFQLVARSDNHLDGHSRDIEAVDGQPVAEQRIVAVLAAGLTGIVHNAAGKPVVGATVTGEVSREALMAQFRAQRDAADAANGGAQTQGQGQGRGGRRGQPADQANGTPANGGRRGGNNADFARMREVMAATETARTNDQGEFSFSKLPRAQVKLTAEHRSYLRTIQEPVDATLAPKVEIVMPPALTLAGTILDARSGQPITSFGIASRRHGPQPDDNAPPAGFGGRGGRGRQGQSDPNADPRGAPQDVGATNGKGNGGRGGRGRGNDPNPPVVQQTPEQKAAQDALVRAQLGPSGLVPGRVPLPSEHTGGAFLVDHLQVGEYVLDVDAPGYVRMASEPIKVDGASPRDGIVLRLEPGSVIRGIVVNNDRSPVSGAAVELLLPDAVAEIVQAEADRIGGNNGFGGNGFGGGFGGFGARGIRLARTTTATDGTFTLAAQRPGTTLRLHVQAEGLVDYEDPALVMPAVGQTREITVTMMTGAVVKGIVHKLEPGVSARVTLTHVGDNSRHGAAVDPITGAYEIVGLPAGGYFVALNQRGGDEDVRRAQMANAIVQRERTYPDVTVALGSTVRYDLVAGQNALGALTGTVFLNGLAAVGMQVRLTRVNAPPAPDAAVDRQTRNQNNRLSTMEQQLLRTNVGVDGAFVLTAIPPASYQVEVLRGNSQNGLAGAGPGGMFDFGGRGGRGNRPGGRGNTPVYREGVEIAAYSQARMTIDLRTSKVEFKMTVPPELAADARLRVNLVLAGEVGDRQPQQWRDLPSFRNLNVQGGGTTGAQEVPSGTYRYQVAGRGLTAVIGDVTVGAGQSQVLNVALQAAPATTTNADNTPSDANPGNPQGRGGRGGRGQGGQRGGGTPGDPANGGGQAPPGGRGQGRRGGQAGGNGGGQPGGG